VVLLRKREKWAVQRRNHEVGDLVLLQDVNLPRNNWPLGRIVKVYSGSRNVVRSADVLISKLSNNVKDFSTKVVHRPIVKLILLKSSDEL